MRVLRAEALGMCFGVRDALRIVERLPDPRSVAIHGELVHNATVLGELRSRGFIVTGEEDRGSVPAAPTVVVTAHGVSERERARLEAAGKALVDTTCPLVARVHRAARRLDAEGFHVLVVGRRGHVEVRGIVEDLRSFEVIESPAEVRRFRHPRLGIVAQSTTTEEELGAVHRAVCQWNPGAEIRLVDTVCQPTKDRQGALEALLDRVDAMVVVGGRNSNNTLRLVARCRDRAIPVLHVEKASDIRAEWFAGRKTVGLTAGTSTPDSVIDDVQRALEAMA